MSSPLRIVFAGTPEFSLPPLQRLIDDGLKPVAVYTQPDRPAGRGRQLTPSPVKALALAHDIEVRQPLNFKNPADKEALRALQPDLMIVVAYGLILPQSVLDIPRYGCWNLHASLLPRWRGAAPIQRAIEAGDTETGVCLMQMEKGLDTGPVLLRRQLDISAQETAGELHYRLAALGAQVMHDGLTLLRIGLKPVAQAQPELGVRYAHKLEKSEARLDLQQSAQDLARRVRAFSPWPVAELELQGERLRVHRAEALDVNHGQSPGCLLKADREGIDLACAQGVLRLLDVQREGGRVQPVADYLNARRTPLS